MAREDRGPDDNVEGPDDLRRRRRDRFLRGRDPRRPGSSRKDRARIDLPGHPSRPLVRVDVDPELFGRFSERFARFMGTARFIAYMTGFVLVWIGWNLAAPAALRFDTYPFIFLTLMLSLQASYAAPLILLAQNRQEARDRVQYEQDRDVTTQTRADIEFLAREVASLRSAVGEVATRDYLRSELRGLMQDLDERLGTDGEERRRETDEAPA